jgi:hypothetical protein
MEFREFPKMPRLSREVIITEKIDGTNAAVVIEALGNEAPLESVTAVVDGFALYAQSRTRIIKPGDDNFAFALWVKENAEALASLGEGHHFGEWWGKGIQRNYGLSERRFSLFNVHRWGEGGKDEALRPACCSVVPVLYRGDFDTIHVNTALLRLEASGSRAAPGFMNPEGIVVFHTAANVGFKKTIKDDEVPKSVAQKKAA